MLVQTVMWKSYRILRHRDLICRHVILRGSMDSIWQLLMEIGKHCSSCLRNLKSHQTELRIQAMGCIIRWLKQWTRTHLRLMTLLGWKRHARLNGTKWKELLTNRKLSSNWKEKAAQLLRPFLWPLLRLLRIYSEIRKWPRSNSFEWDIGCILVLQILQGWPQNSLRRA